MLTEFFFCKNAKCPFKFINTVLISQLIKYVKRRFLLTLCYTVQLNNLLVTLYKNGQNTGDNPSHLRSNEQIQKFMRTKLSFPSYPIRTKEDFFRFTDHPKGKFKKP